MPETTLRFEGEPVTLGGREYIVPPLSLGQVKRLAPLLDKLDTSSSGLPQAEQVDAVVKVMHSALSRNYPEMKEEELLDLIDLGNMVAMIKAAMRTSGLVPRGEGKA